MEQHYVWIIPYLKEILVEDRGTPPVGASEYKIFNDWAEANKYANAKSEELGYSIEYDNWAGRLTAHDIENGFI